MSTPDKTYLKNKVKDMKTEIEMMDEEIEELQARATLFQNKIQEVINADLKIQELGQKRNFVTNQTEAKTKDRDKLQIQIEVYEELLKMPKADSKKQKKKKSNQS